MPAVYDEATILPDIDGHCFFAPGGGAAALFQALPGGTGPLQQYRFLYGPGQGRLYLDGNKRRP